MRCQFLALTARAVVVALTACVVLVNAHVAAAEPARAIEYAYPDQSVWTTRLDGRGEPANPLLDFAAVLFRQAGIPWHGKSYPAARMFEYLQNGTAEFSMLVNAPSLRTCCLVGQTPVAATELRAYWRDGAAPVVDKADLAGKHVVTIRGYSYAGLAAFLADPQNRVVNDVVTSHEAAFALLARGRADYVLDYAGPAAEIQAAHPIAGLRHATLSRLEVFLVLSKTYPDAEAVMARLEGIAEDLRRQGVRAVPGP